MNTIRITLPDSSVREYAAGTTGLEIAASISRSLEKDALAIEVNGSIRDLNLPIDADASIRLITFDSDEGHDVYWHSSSHIMAQAIEELYPGTRFGAGPAIENGFYYDVDSPHAFTPEDFPLIENKMKEIAARNLSIQRQELAKADAIGYFKSKRTDPYKVEILESTISDDAVVSIYHQGDFSDLCTGPHLPFTSRLKAVKVMSVSSSYWRGDASRQVMQRIYAVSFPKQTQLDEYLNQLEEAKKRDHKKLGKQLQLFLFSPMVGRGLPVWLPNGTLVRRTLEAFLRDELLKRGYVEVITPHIGNLDMYRTSGHYPYYSDSQFAPMDVEDEQYLLKPMNCPHHHQIYSSQPRSYRDLPLRLAEFGTVYRYEQSGELNGLSRVRGFTQDDAHIYCTHDQLKAELINAIELTQLVFHTFNMPVKTRLSFRDPANQTKYAGSPEMWDQAEKEILEVAQTMGLDYFIGIGEAAFYGPKFDFIVRDAIGRKWQLGTVQVDYVMPERFDLEFVNSENTRDRPVVIHRAPFGSMERFLSILIEHFAGNFPLWLAPLQVAVLPISDQVAGYAESVADQLRNAGLRVKTDHRNEKIGYKIRDWETQKVPVMLICGQKEADDGQVSVRRHGKGDLGSQPVDGVIASLLAEVTSKAM
ncbi:MAG: threonine--tRNA ligase [Bacteroidetes bacterium]|nr:threonine--tRNA ligase [Bacteroidota bacterium]